MPHRLPGNPSPAAFFTLTFLLSVPFYGLNALAYRNVLGGPEMGAVYIALFTITPVAAASLLTLRSRGFDGVKALWRRAFDWGRIRRARWYLAILLLPFLLLLLALGWMALAEVPVSSAVVPPLALPAALAVFLLMATGEELGWMGYAFEPLQARHGALGAALILGGVWALWHLPFFVVLFPDPVNLGAQLLTLVWTRVLIAWAVNAAGGAVVAAILYHAADNTALVILPDIVGAIPWGPVVLCAQVIAAAVAVTLLWGPGTLARWRFSARAGPDAE